MWKRLNSNQMCEYFSYKEVFLIKRFLIERFYCIYIYIYIYIYIHVIHVIRVRIHTIYSTMFLSRMNINGSDMLIYYCKNIQYFVTRDVYIYVCVCVYVLSKYINSLSDDSFRGVTNTTITVIAVNITMHST